MIHPRLALALIFALVACGGRVGPGGRGSDGGGGPDDGGDAGGIGGTGGVGGAGEFGDEAEGGGGGRAFPYLHASGPSLAAPDTVESIREVAGAGSLLIVGSGEQLDLLDTARLDAPRHLGSLSNAGQPVVVEGEGTGLLTLASTGSLRQKAGTLQMTGELVARLQRLSLADPARPRRQATLDLPGSPVYSQRVGDRLVVTTRQSLYDPRGDKLWLLLVDLAAPEPRELGRLLAAEQREGPLPAPGDEPGLLGATIQVDDRHLLLTRTRGASGTSVQYPGCGETTTVDLHRLDAADPLTAWASFTLEGALRHPGHHLLLEGPGGSLAHVAVVEPRGAARVCDGMPRPPARFELRQLDGAGAAMVLRTVALTCPSRTVTRAVFDREGRRAFVFCGQGVDLVDFAGAAGPSLRRLPGVGALSTPPWLGAGPSLLSLGLSDTCPSAAGPAGLLVSLADLALPTFGRQQLCAASVYGSAPLNAVWSSGVVVEAGGARGTLAVNVGNRPAQVALFDFSLGVSEGSGRTAATLAARPLLTVPFQSAEDDSTRLATLPDGRGFALLGRHELALVSPGSGGAPPEVGVLPLYAPHSQRVFHLGAHLVEEVHLGERRELWARALPLGRPAEPPLGRIELGPVERDQPGDSFHRVGQTLVRLHRVCQPTDTLPGCDHRATFQVYDFRDPARPQVVASGPVPGGGSELGYPQSVVPTSTGLAVLSASRADAGRLTATLAFLDLADPAAPVVTSHPLDPVAGPWEVDGHLLQADGGSAGQTVNVLRRQPFGPQPDGGLMGPQKASLQRWRLQAGVWSPDPPLALPGLLLRSWIGGDGTRRLITWLMEPPPDGDWGNFLQPRASQLTLLRLRSGESGATLDPLDTVSVQATFVADAAATPAFFGDRLALVGGGALLLGAVSDGKLLLVRHALDREASALHAMNGRLVVAGPDSGLLIDPTPSAQPRIVKVLSWAHTDAPFVPSGDGGLYVAGGYPGLQRISIDGAPEILLE
jgi:hypothetical protein